MNVRYKKSIKWLIAVLSLAMISCTVTAIMTMSRPERVFAATVSPRCYQQTDARWTNYTYTIKASGVTTTLGASGCGILSTVNTVNYLTGNFINPLELADWGYANDSFNGTGGQGLMRNPFYSNVTAKFGATYGFGISNLAYGKITDGTLINHLKNGGSAIIHVPNHFMAVNGYNSSTGQYLVYDSGAGAKRGTSPNGSWLTASQLNANSLTIVDWFCLVSRTGSAPNYQTGGQYDLRITSSGGGIGHFGNNVTYQRPSGNQIVDFEVAPNAGYKVSSITVNGVSRYVFNNGGKCVYDLRMPFANTTIAVTFVSSSAPTPVTTFSLKTQVVSGKGTAHFGNNVTSATIQAGTSVNVQVTPQSGYKTTSVKVNETPITVVNNGADYVYKFTMPSANTVVYVTFAEEDVDLRLKTQVVSGEGTAHFGNGITETTSKKGNKINVQITPNEGYKISEIKVNDTAITVVDNGADHVYQFTMPSANATVYVKFEAIIYTLKTQVVSGNGTAHFGNNVTSTVAQAGQQVNCEITPNEGYKISEIKVNDTPITVVDNGAGRVYQFAMPSANATVYVKFEALLKLKAEVSGVGGKVDLGDGLTEISLIGGEDINCHITPSKGYKISKILINGVSQGVRNGGKEHVYKFTMPKVETVISVQFKKDENSGSNKNYYTITVNQSEGGKIRADAVEAVENTTITVVATPDDGFALDYIMVNGNKISGNTFALNGNSVITAKFIEADKRTNNDDGGEVVTEEKGCSSSLNEGGLTALALVTVSAVTVLCVKKRRGN